MRIASTLKRSSLLFASFIWLTACASYQQLPSENYDRRIKSLVLHYTAIDYADSVQALVPAPGLSSHYLIPQRLDPSYPEQKLEVMQLVAEQDRAWHAGDSYWQGRNQLNDTSIGIEIVNVPQCQWDHSISSTDSEHAPHRLCSYPDYDPVQIELLTDLAKDILARNADIHPTAVVGHADIAPLRKSDPGPRFPWYQLYQHGIGAWYEQPRLSYYWLQFNQQQPSLGLLQAALNAYGYGITETGRYDALTEATLNAFQMHFLPWQVDGQADSYTAAAAFALLERYFPEKLQPLWQRYQHELELISELKQPAPLRKGQIDRSFPEAESERSDRTLVNDRLPFKAYKGRGSIQLNSNLDAKVSILVNGKELSLATPLKAGEDYNYSLWRRTQDGINTLHVAAIEPADAKLQVTIPYPQLINRTADYGHAFEQVDALINADIDNGFPGVVLLVIKDGAIIKHTAYGYAKRYDRQGQLLATPSPMQLDTLFDVASNTKPFATGLAIMQLVDRGLLDLNQPLYHYLPEYRGDGREARLVRDLLTHQSGYDPQVRFHDPDNGFGRALFSQRKRRTEQLLLNKVPFRHSNGIQTRYSDTNFMLLGLLVERVTGLPLDGYVEQHIYAPLGLRNSLFKPLEKGYKPAQIAATELAGNSRGGRVSFPNMRDYTLQGEVHDEKAFHSFQGVAGHAGLFTTAADLAVLIQSLLNGGGYSDVQLFERSIVEAFTKPHERDHSFGLAWRRAADGELRWHFGPYASASAYGHTGWTGTATVIDPALDLGIILLTNARHSPIVDDADGDGYQFLGKTLETGNYGSIISAIYEAVLHHPSSR